MKMQLTTVNQWVHDQDEALEFYTETLGMELRMDVTMPEMGDFRWLTVGPVGQPDIAVVLMTVPGPPVFEPETTAQLQDIVAKGAAGGLFFETDDIQATYEELKGKGVEFTQDRCNSRTESTPVSATHRVTTSASCRRLRPSHPREGSAEGGALPARQSTESRSTTNTSGSCGAITPPAPRAPYAMAEGIVSWRRPPTFMPCTPASHPGITWPLPSLNANGCPRFHEASNSSPVVNATPRSAPSPCGRSSPRRRPRRRCRRSRARTGCRLPACRSAGARVAMYSGRPSAVGGRSAAPVAGPASVSRSARHRCSGISLRRSQLPRAEEHLKPEACALVRRLREAAVQRPAEPAEAASGPRDDHEVARGMGAERLQVGVAKRLRRFRLLDVVDPPRDHPVERDGKAEEGMRDAGVAPVEQQVAAVVDEDLGVVQIVVLDRLRDPAAASSSQAARTPGSALRAAGAPRRAAPRSRRSTPRPWPAVTQA